MRLRTIPMKTAIVNWECWKDGRAVRWGNATVTYRSQADRESLVEDLCTHAATMITDETGKDCSRKEIRIVGFFPVP